MSDLQAIADRVQIEALRGEATDAAMMRDYDRAVSLFTDDAVVRIPHIGAEVIGREEIRAGAERLPALLDYFVQTTHPGTIQLDGDTASGRAYICELIRRYLDHSPLAGSPPGQGALDYPPATRIAASRTDPAAR